MSRERRCSPSTSRATSPPKIARRCKDGLASCVSFSIPRESVRDIVTAMAFEQRGSKAPTSLAEVEGADAIKDFPRMAARIVRGEGDRIEAKQKRGKPLTLADLSKLSKLERLADQIQRTLRRPGRKPTEPPPNGNRAVSSPTVEGLARAMREERGVRPT
jgi:hypothetical protein